MRAIGRPIPIIFDTDIGCDVDDAYALVLAARSPQIELRAVTTLYGKAGLRSAIARKVLLLMGKTGTPVASGESQALDGHKPFSGEWEGKGILVPGEPSEDFPQKTAAELITETLLASEEKITLVAVGGLSNVATILRSNPSLKSKIARFVIVGGCSRSIVVEGKTIPDKFETNLHNDVNAAKIVLESGLPITLVPADVTFRTKLLKTDLARIRASVTPLAKAMSAMTAEWEPHLKDFLDCFSVPASYADDLVMLHDPLAVATLVDPNIAKIVRQKFCVEVNKDEIRLVIDPAGPITIDLVTEVDLIKLSNLVAAKVVQ
jgi:inosine-uridine nucleoside N-ribohydrolase